MLIKRILLADMRELWLMRNVWKEPTASGYSTTVMVVCTSREACRRYRNTQTHDFYLDEGVLDALDSPLETGLNSTKIDPEPDDDRIFADAQTEDESDDWQFRLISFEKLIKEVRREEEHHRHGLTVLVNPGYGGSGELDADGVYTSEEFLVISAASPAIKTDR